MAGTWLSAGASSSCRQAGSRQPSVVPLDGTNIHTTPTHPLQMMTITVNEENITIQLYINIKFMVATDFQNFSQLML